MAHLYGARKSFHPLRPKKCNQTTNTKCRKVDMYGEMGIQNFSGFISQASEMPQTFRFSGPLFATNAVPKKLSKKSPRGAKKKMLSRILLIFTKMTIIRLGTPIFWLSQTSTFDLNF